MRTLLVDTNRAAYPLYQELERLGHEVWVIGRDPDEPLAKMAKRYARIDYSDTSALAHFVADKCFDYLVPGCTDLSYQVCATINESRFPGFDTSENSALINDKSKFRELGEKIGLRIPSIVSVDEACKRNAVIVKAVDSFSGRGITILRSPSNDMLQEALQKALAVSFAKKTLIEELIDGQLFSYTCFYFDGEIVADFVVREDCVTYPFAVDTSMVCPAPDLEILESLRQDILLLRSSLQLTDGLFHTQFIQTDDDYRIIEMTRRCPGDLYSYLIEYSTGYPYARSYLAPFIGETPARSTASESCQRIIRHTVATSTSLTYWGLAFTRPVSIKQFLPIVTIGDHIPAEPFGRAGLLFLQCSSDIEQRDTYQQLLEGRLYRFV